MRYIGEKCPLCGLEFTEKDDIVVCPECGTPSHRECYKNNNGCINKSLHGTGFEWKQSEIKSNSQELKRCPNCGAENSDENAHCFRCGALLDNHTESASDFSQEQRDESEPVFGSMPFPGGFVSTRIDDSTELDGVTVGELSEYVGTNKLYFLANFMRFGKYGSKFSINLTAFLFPYYYFFYRKMYLFGAVFLLADFLCGIPQMLVYLPEMAKSLGITVLSTADFAFVDSSWFVGIASAASLVSYAMMFIGGVFANYLYYRQAVHDIKEIKSETKVQTGYREAIAQKGGTSWKLVAAAIAAYVILSWAGMLLMMMIF